MIFTSVIQGLKNEANMTGIMSKINYNLEKLNMKKKQQNTSHSQLASPRCAKAIVPSCASR